MPSFRCKIKKLRFQGILTEKETERILDALDKAEKTNRGTAEWRIVGKTTLHYECSKCGGAGDEWDKFCKHCGADMRKESEEEE